MNNAIEYDLTSLFDDSDEVIFAATITDASGNVVAEHTGNSIPPLPAGHYSTEITATKKPGS
jgi:hypothetical protein